VWSGHLILPGCDITTIFIYLVTCILLSFLSQTHNTILKFPPFLNFVDFLPIAIFFINATIFHKVVSSMPAFFLKTRYNLLAVCMDTDCIGSLLKLKDDIIERLGITKYAKYLNL